MYPPILKLAEANSNWTIANLVQLGWVFFCWSIGYPQPWEHSFIYFLTLFRPGFFYHLKVQGGSLGTLLMISGTIKASPMKLCTVIVLLKAYQNTKRNFQKYDLWRHNDVITKNNGKIRTSAKPSKLYIIRKEMMSAFRKCNFYWNWVTEQKLWPFK